MVILCNKGTSEIHEDQVNNVKGRSHDGEGRD